MSSNDFSPFAKWFVRRSVDLIRRVNLEMRASVAARICQSTILMNVEAMAANRHTCESSSDGNFAVGVSKINRASDVGEGSAIDGATVAGEIAGVTDGLDSAATWSGASVSCWLLKSVIE